MPEAQTSVPVFGGGLQADEDDVEEDGSGEEDIELRVVVADGLWLSGGAGHGYLDDASSSAVQLTLERAASMQHGGHAESARV